jgi:type III pantothenate kinase
MDLVIDIGNTSVKAALFLEGEIAAAGQWENGPSDIIEWLAHEAGTAQARDRVTEPAAAADQLVQHAIISCVRKDDQGFRAVLEKAGTKVLLLGEHTPLPLTNRYRSPASLGYDRLAAAVGANARFPGRNLLIIDTGTAITIDFVSAGDEFLGGNISPGLSMRFKALHRFTDNLPLLDATGDAVFPGTDTESAILSGVQSGIIFELDEYINRGKIRYPDLQVVMTGGDARFFVKKLKNSIFVDLDLNLRGLHRILTYNV